ncbi:MAG: tRNA (adenosine(37)-N6)-dimethylallyltransferase MiaA [Actinobacteria bacterium]|nr:tRNA (adenosine(37)-N6)-dimethylallyltransferase MiaA [Actinomycetota bacterium]
MVNCRAMKSENNIFENLLKKTGIDIGLFIRKALSLKKVVIICGPTCAGKSKVASRLARILHTDIISVDSMQVYRGMDIGTDKYDTSSAGIKQYMIDVFDPDRQVTAVLFRDMCREIIEKEFFLKGKIPLMAGGSGLYIRSVNDELEFLSFSGSKKIGNSAINEKPSGSIRAEILKEVKNGAAGRLYEELQAIDPVYAAKISKNDSRRIIRAMEVFKTTGQPFSNFQKSWNKRKSRYNSTFIGLEREKNSLGECISERVESMFKKGFISEVKKLAELGYGNSTSMLQAVGYRQVKNFLDGNITIDECKNDITSATKKLVKKQMTWFKADPRVNWINADNYETITDLLIEVISIIWKDLSYEKD